jgi:hypothetical protein
VRRWLIVVALMSGCAGARTGAPAWMAGRWTGPEGGGEAWTRVGAALVGVGWLRGVDGAWGYEVMRIDAPGGLRFTAWPSGQAPAAFAERARGRGEVVFAAPEHDFPKVVRYRQRPGGLVARVEGDRPADGQDFNYVETPETRAPEAEAADRALVGITADAKVWRGAQPVDARGGWAMTRAVRASGQAPDGGLAFTVGTYERTDAAERGDYVFVWRRSDAGWGLEVAVFNSG